MNTVILSIIFITSGGDVKEVQFSNLEPKRCFEYREYLSYDYFKTIDAREPVASCMFNGKNLRKGVKDEE